MMSTNAKLYDVNPGAGTYKVWPFEKINLKVSAANIYQRILFDRDNNLWLGASNGLYFFNRKTGKFSFYDLQLKKGGNQAINDLSFDSFNNLWIGTVTQGLIKYENRPNLKSYTYNASGKNSIGFGWANNIYEALDGSIIITTGGSRTASGINILDPKTGQFRLVPYSKFLLPLNYVASIWEYAPGEFYLGCAGAVLEYAENTNTLKQTKIHGLPDSAIILHHFTA